MMDWLVWVGWIAGGFFLLLLATLVFDVLHICLHRMAESRYTAVRALGNLHQTHHRFLDTELVIREEHMRANVFHHVLPEFVVQFSVTLALALFFPWPAVAVALALETLVFICILREKPGFDINHRHVERLLPYRPLYFCVPEYHLLHHRYPSAYFSSWIKTTDHLLKSGTAFKNRRAVLTGVETGFGQAMKAALEARGAVVRTADFSESKQPEIYLAQLKEAEILLLCHVADADARYSQWIEAFYDLHKNDRFPVEVWTLEPAQPEDSLAVKEWYKSGKVIYRYIDLESHKADIVCVPRVINNIARGFNFVPARWNRGVLKSYWQLVWK